MTVVNYHTVNGEVIGETTVGQPRVDYLTDALGSVTATVNQSAQVVNTYRYKPSGGLLAKTGPGPDPAFGWNGANGYRPTGNKFSDFYVAARHADSTTGRWPTMDPAWQLVDRLNPYGYGYNAPNQEVDATGLSPSFGKGGNGCSNKIQASVNACCNTIQQAITMGKLNAANVSACMAKYWPNGPWNAGDIAAALRLLAATCGTGAGDNVCIWCLGTPAHDALPNQHDINLGWPPHCTSPCAADPDNLAGAKRAGPPGLKIGRDGPPLDPQTGLPWHTNPSKPGELRPPPSSSVGCPRTVHQTNCNALDNPAGMPKCDSVIAICRDVWPNKSADYHCYGLWHEIIHTGDLGHVYAPGTHDFVRTIMCCVCKTMYGTNASTCDNDCKNMYNPPKTSGSKR